MSRPTIGTLSGQLSAAALVQRLYHVPKRVSRHKAVGLDESKRNLARRAMEAILRDGEHAHMQQVERMALVNLCGWPNGRLEVRGGILIAHSGRKSAQLVLFDFIVARAAAGWAP